MKALIFEGNTKAYCENMSVKGDTPYHKKFEKTIQTINSSIACDVDFPAEKEFVIYSVEDLEKYDFVFWTGSALNAYDKTHEVLGQIEQAKIVFDSGVPFYGSCWGMQIAVMASGGDVGVCENGLEVGVAKNIFVTDTGKTHPFMKGRTDSSFGAYCVHSGETKILPPVGAIVLAFNEHTKIQAIEIRHSKGVFWGVQYHPEMNALDMVEVLERNSLMYIKKNIIKNDTRCADFIKNMSIGFEDSLTEYNRTIEFRNFIEYYM